MASSMQRTYYKGGMTEDVKMFEKTHPHHPMPHQAFLNASVRSLVAQMSVDEKVAMLGAPNWWNTHKIDRLGIPAIRMSDGPNGVRGSSHFISSPAQCIPCATSLGATFDPDLMYDVGAFLAAEAKLKSSVALLAPTCNIQRNPLGGRAFESFSEDPHLSGTMAAGYVNGLQKNGVAATIKHFVGNDQEHERTAASSEISPRALREIYLMPFMIAQRDSRPMAYMTSYGRVNGIHCSEDPRLIGDQGILRKEWGFKGIVMSDWFGTYGVDQPIKAGLDLEMPGPPRWRSEMLMRQCLSCQKLLVSDLDKRVMNLVTFVQKVARLSPDVVFGNGVEHNTRDTPETKSFIRKVAAEGMVLLKNHNGVLPIRTGQKIAVIGPNAKGRVMSGGGSAFLKASYCVNPWEGLTRNHPADSLIEYALGCYAHKFLPTLEEYLTTPAGRPGWEAVFYDQPYRGEVRDEVAKFTLNDTRVKLNDFLPDGLGAEWTMKLNGKLTLDYTGPFELGLTVAGRAKLWVDDKLTIDNWTKQRPGNFFYGQGTVEEKAIVNVTAGRPLKIHIVYTNTFGADGGERDLSQPALMRGVRLGGCPAVNADEEMRKAVELARQSDVPVIIAGLTSEWEAEGSDRPTLDLPGRQHELIRKVAEANPNTIVVIQAGSATSMPYADAVAGIVQAWYSGNEVGNAIADILYGRVNPGGKLPLSIPRHIEDIGPAAFNVKSENGKIYYREDLFVGYKSYHKSGIKPLFPFGYGLSFTQFALSNLKLSEPMGENASTFSVNLEVTVTNTGKVTGSEVVQVYVTLPSSSQLTHPERQLRGFAKVKDLAPGTSHTVKIPLNKYAVSHWDDRENAWVAEEGHYTISVGTSSDHLPLVANLAVEHSFSWNGL